MNDPGYLHPIFMSYRIKDGVWLYEFQDDLNWKLGPVRRTSDPDVIRGLAARGGAFKNSKDKSSFDFGLSQGNGAVSLRLTAAQVAALGDPHK